MKIDVRFRSEMDEAVALKDHVHRRADFQLGRFEHELTHVVVRLSDVNGPRGGLDKRCQVTAKGRKIGAFAIDELQGDARAAVDVALERASRQVSQKLARTRSVRRGPRPSLAFH
jgi:hypothetical protein